MRDVHQSGHATATDEQWATMLADLATHGDLAGLTEARGIDPPAGWEKHRGSDESEILWDPTVWTVEAHGVEQIPTPPWKRGTATRTSFALTWALLVHRDTGLRLLRGVGHFPAHLYRPASKAAHTAALAGLGPLVSRLDVAQDPDEISLSFDFNVDLSQPAVRRQIEAAVRGTGLRLVTPPKRTHDHRIIDGHLTTLTCHQRAMLPGYPGMDHRGYWLDLRADAAPAEPESTGEEQNPMVEIADFIEAPNSGGDYPKNLLVVHVTISPEVNHAARGVVAFWKRGRTGSTQYVVDNREIIQSVRETAYAWAAGTHANKCGIHVELCGFIQSVRQWRDGYSTAELDLAARLFAELAAKYGIPIRKIGPAQIRTAYETGRPEDGGICGHVDITRTWPGDTSHTDPGVMFPWDHFLSLVRHYATNPRADVPQTEEDWFDMASSKDLEDAIRNTRITVKAGKDDAEKEWRLEALLAHIEQEQDTTQKMLKTLLARDADALAEKVAAKISVNVSADAEVVKQAVKDALAEGVEG